MIYDIRMNYNDNIYCTVKPAVFLPIVRAVTSDICLYERCIDLEDILFVEYVFTIHDASIPVDSASLTMRLQ
jgi:hypothetical protein